jgi:peptidoglycan/xylan/chitin deacetylase (PgdA/CDA1 family)
VRRTGDRPKLVALTFDDGPDPTWTPQILAILEKYHVPGTFFVIGENGVGNRGLLRRMVADGDEIGNHSYTHPNMANSTPTGIKLELNATQRLIEAYTGRSTRLFRAPYFGDAEPTTADELDPALVAQKQGYTIVGLHADPGDWMRRPADQVVQIAVSAIENSNADRSANVILLHDGGGERSQTVAALPRIIEQLQAKGYRFVPVSTLAGMRRDDVMPEVSGWDLVAVRADIGIFAVLAAALSTLNWTFFFAIALGTLRAVGLTGLALFRSGARICRGSTGRPICPLSSARDGDHPGLQRGARDRGFGPPHPGQRLSRTRRDRRRRWLEGPHERHRRAGLRTRAARAADDPDQRRQGQRAQPRPCRCRRGNHRRPRRRYPVRAADHRQARALVREARNRRGGGQCQSRQPGQPRHPLAGGGICHRAEHRTPRAHPLRRDHGRARRGGGMASRGAQ